MRVTTLDYRPESTTRDEHQGYYAAIHAAWYYVLPPDPRTGERGPLVPLGMDPRALDNCNDINAFFKEHMVEDVAPKGSGFSGVAPRDGVVELAFQDSAYIMLKGYWEAWYRSRGHQIFSEFYQSVDRWLASFKEFRDSEWKELVKQRKQEERGKAVDIRP
ncbi:hypothetical protein LCGC14_1925800 [marine sediment metagenome]|uniref:Uncharacterized protein n=1 Tax=marine sediment metagenome TaxID=412755 RepID=A0A0F9GCV8_9ZZZZ